jgi:hypothetical protein
MMPVPIKDRRYKEAAEDDDKAEFVDVDAASNEPDAWVWRFKLDPN